MQYGIRISEDELGEDSKHYAGDYLVDKEWETGKTYYQQIIGSNNLKLVIATTKRTGSRHLLMPKDQEWDEKLDNGGTNDQL